MNLSSIFSYLCIVFILFLLYHTVIAYNNEAFAYNFVKCPGDNNTYPEGTDCNPDKWDVKEDEEATEEEEKAMKENDEEQ